MTLRSKNVSMGLLEIFGISASFAGCCCFSFFVSGSPSERRIKRRAHGDIGRAPCQLLQLGEQRPLGVFRHLPAEGDPVGELRLVRY